MTDGHDRSRGIVHEIRWCDAIPWWLLFRAAGQAFAPTVVILAAVGGLATWAGWSVADQLGLAGTDRAADVIAAARLDDQLTLPLPGGGLPAVTALQPSTGLLPWLGGLVDRLPTAAMDVLQLVKVPFQPGASLERVGGALARIGWFVLVWSIFGTAICRRVALGLVGEDAPGPVAATLFGSRKWLASFNAVIFVLLGMLLLAIPGMLLGLAMRTEWGLAFAGAVWPIVLAGAVVLAILAVGVVAGWPLMVATVGVERGDAFQAISTSFSYLYQRPLHYAFYLLVALAVAVPTIAAAGVLADATAMLAMWAASFGMGHERTAAVIDGLSAVGPGGTVMAGSETSGVATDAGRWGLSALGFWMRGVRTVLASFGWGYFWAITTAAYVLLRQDVDGTELDEVVLEEPGRD
jgi:hypothetical protein